MNKSRGRRLGSPDTRGAILAAARSAFLEQGYRGATVRHIAGEVGVDVRMISHHFGSKRGLFREAMALPLSPSDVLANALTGPPQSWAKGILNAVLTAWDDPETGPPLRRMLLASLDDHDHRPALSGFVEHELIEFLTQRLEGPHPHRRATASVTVVAGMILNRYALGVTPLREMTQAEVIATLAPLLQVALHPSPLRRPRN